MFIVVSLQKSLVHFYSRIRGYRCESCISKAGLEGTVVNRALSPLHGGSLEITYLQSTITNLLVVNMYIGS